MTIITRVWVYADEPDRIHYAVRKLDGKERHLYTDRGDALYEVLQEFR